jgi:hypothetical protein
VLAGTAALVAAPPCALAQNGFPDYRQAAADQYPQQPPPGNSGSSGPPSGQPGAGNGQNGGHNGNGGHHGRKHAGSGTKGASNHGAVLGSSSTGPVAVPTRPVPAATGSLPFTGSDLSGLVVLALVLIAAGLFAGAAARATRRRRRATA